MIHEIVKNFMFGIISLVNLFMSVRYSSYLIDHYGEVLRFYYSYDFTLVVTCLFVNVCLCIFALFILGNLNDFLHRMSVNLIGAYQKLKVLAVLMMLNTSAFGIGNIHALLGTFSNTKFVKKLTFMIIVQFVIQVLHILSIYSLHPDLFGKGWRERLKRYETNEHNRTITL